MLPGWVTAADVASGAPVHFQAFVLDHGGRNWTLIAPPDAVPAFGMVYTVGLWEPYDDTTCRAAIGRFPRQALWTARRERSSRAGDHTRPVESARPGGRGLHAGIKLFAFLLLFLLR